MAKIQKILFPVDFSPSCTAVVPFVKRAAAMYSAKVTLLYVSEPSVSGFEVLARPAPEADDDCKTVACAKLRAYLSAELPSPECPRLLVVGEAASRIAAVARDHDFDLIVMPTHAGLFRRMLLGSTTAKVLNDADCLVFTTQHAETLTPRPLEHREWVCAIGLSADSQRVLRVASELAETAQANLSLIHAVPPASRAPAARLHLEERVESLERQGALDRIHELQRAVGSHAQVSVAVGPIKDALTERARQLQADALIIGRSSQPGAQGRLRDLTYAMVRDAPCPVISV
jgi:nucleotide-binding universal stress UspA family protein